MEGQPQKLQFNQMTSDGHIPFRVTWQGFWLPKCSLSANSLLSKLNRRKIDARNFPLPEFPGFQYSTKPPFDDRKSLAEFLYENIASLFYNPPGRRTKTLGEEVTELILGLQRGLEGLAKSDDEDSSHGLLKIAKRATAELERELNRGNPTLIEELKHELIWPSRQSANNGLNKVIFENLEEKGFGKALEERFKGKKLTSYAQEVVSFLSPYIVNALPEVDALRENGAFEAVANDEVSPVLFILKDLPRKLTLQTVPDWFEAGEEILKLMAGCDNYFAHPYFKTSPFKDRNLASWNRDLKRAWETRAS